MKQELVNVGLRLGLRYPTLKKMSSEFLLNDMVHAWLMKDDDVTEGSGEPSWKSLSKTLEDCGHSGIAAKIKGKGIITLDCYYVHFSMQRIIKFNEICQKVAQILNLLVQLVILFKNIKVVMCRHFWQCHDNLMLLLEKPYNTIRDQGW